MNRASALAGLFFIVSIASVGAEEPFKDVLPAKHRAVALKIDPTAQSGFVLPGSRVDVLLARKIDGDKVEVKTILENALVLAVDQQIDKKEKLTLQTVTLAVPDKDVTAIVMAAKNGTISLALRKSEP